MFKKIFKKLKNNLNITYVMYNYIIYNKMKLN